MEFLTIQEIEAYTLTSMENMETKEHTIIRIRHIKTFIGKLGIMELSIIIFGGVIKLSLNVILYQNTQDLSNILNEIFTEYPKDTIDTMMQPTSTHDISRAIELFATNSFNPRKGHNWDLEYGNASEFVKNHQLTKEEYELGKRRMKSYLVALAFLPGIFFHFLWR